MNANRHSRADLNNLDVGGKMIFEREFYYNLARFFAGLKVRVLERASMPFKIL
jgi:hypothetical protein